MKKRQRRKNRAVKGRIPFPKTLSMVLLGVAVFGVSYVHLCARCDTLGGDIKQLESERRTTRSRAINEQDRWSNTLAPANIERAIRRHQLAMILPDERQIVRVRHGHVQTLLTLAYNP